MSISVSYTSKANSRPDAAHPPTVCKNVDEVIELIAVYKASPMHDTHRMHVYTAGGMTDAEMSKLSQAGLVLGSEFLSGEHEKGAHLQS